MFWTSGSHTYVARAPDASDPRDLRLVPGTVVGRRAGQIYVAGLGDVRAFAPGRATRPVSRFLERGSPRCAAAGKYGWTGVVVTEDETVYARTWTDCMNERRFVWAVRRSSPGDLDGVELAATDVDPTDGRWPTGGPVVDERCVYWLELGAGGTVSLTTVAR